MQDIFNLDEIREYTEKIQNQAKEENIQNSSFVVETKIDGLTAALEYKERKICKRCNERKWASRRRCNRKLKNNKKYTKGINRKY